MQTLVKPATAASEKRTQSGPDDDDLSTNLLFDLLFFRRSFLKRQPHGPDGASNKPTGRHPGLSSS